LFFGTGINDPVFPDARLLVFPEFFIPVVLYAVLGDDFHRQVGGAVQPLLRQTGQILFGDKKQLF
jgi:hypothetical protein